VTRDACIENWVWEERQRKKQEDMDVDGEENDDSDEQGWGGEIGSGYPSGRNAPFLSFLFQNPYSVNIPDPKTVAWLNRVFDNVFGFPSIARFSWTTVKLKLDKNGAGVKWSVFSSYHLCILVNRCRSTVGLTMAKIISSRHLQLPQDMIKTGVQWRRIWH
jgi:ribonuclease H2 subunit A